MKQQSIRASAPFAERRCNHPAAVLIDPTERELREFEAMLAQCPNCCDWSPGDGPIMAVLTTSEDTGAKSLREEKRTSVSSVTHLDFPPQGNLDAP